MPAPAAPHRILIVRPSALGDVCRTVPVLASLRAAYPDARIEWLVQDAFAPAIAAHPALDDVVPFPRRSFARWWRSPRVAREVLRWLGDLRRRRYDLVLDVQGLGRSGFFTWMTRAARRVGSASAREGAWLGYTARHRVPPNGHAVDDMLALVEAEGIAPVRDLRLYVADADAAWWTREGAARDLEPGGYDVVAPTGRWESKRWPTERWRELLSSRAPDARPVVVIGAPGEEAQIDGLTDGVAGRLENLVGACTIGQTMAVIRDAAMVIATDSAPLHMAVGFGRPAVALFGPTDPARVGPYGDGATVVQKLEPGETLAQSYRRGDHGAVLMRRIAVDDVRRAIGALRPASVAAE